MQVVCPLYEEDSQQVRKRSLLKLERNTKKAFKIIFFGPFTARGTSRNQYMGFFIIYKKFTTSLKHVVGLETF
jgi:hypothetical protein